MTRFHADVEDERRDLFTDAIGAHRARESQFCTFEVDGGKPWIQVGTSDEADGSGAGILNLDCTDGELDRLKSLLNEFQAFAIEGLTSPENVEGTNVRVRTFADDDRLGGFVERCFRSVYAQPEAYVVWASEI